MRYFNFSCIYFSDNHSNETLGFDKIRVEREILWETVTPQFEKHCSGWNIWIQSPFTNIKSIINEDGEYMTNRQ